MTATPPPEGIAAAVSSATYSRCEKSKRGAAIVSAADSVLAQKTNGPPYDYVCRGDASCRDACAKYCMHAEQRAILAAAMFHGPFALEGASVVHAKVVAGELVPSGAPSCWQCSRLVVECDLAGVWLYHAQGWTFYEAHLFHEATLDHHAIQWRRRP